MVPSAIGQQFTDDERDVLVDDVIPNSLPNGALPGTGLPASAAAYLLLFDANPEPMWVHDAETLRFLAVNDAAVAAYGWSRRELLTKSVNDIRDSDQPLRLVRRSGPPATAWRHRRRDGSVFEVEVTTSPMTVAGRPALLALARDVTEERALTAALHYSEERFRTVFAHAPLAQMTISLDGRLTQVNAAFCAMSGLGDYDLLGTRFADLLSNGANFEANLARAARQEVEVFELEDTLLREGRRGVDVEITAATVRDSDGSLQYVVAMMNDVTESRRAQKFLAERVHRDPLTGLPNRLLFLERLDKALRRSEQEGGSVAVLFIDLDRFKQVNDTLGHAAGDQVLLAVTGRLRNAVKESDTIARFGGDEFTVMCERVPGPTEAMNIGLRILEALGAPIRLDDEDRVFSVSIGVAVAGADDHVTGDFLVQGADSAMSRAKQNGRNRCELFDQDSRARTIARLRRTDEMRRALDEHQLRLEYQPMVRLHGDASPDVEALLRWDHPALGSLGPPDFIALAEESRLIVPIGGWVLEQACRDVAALTPTAGVSVNLSARQLARGDLVDVVQAALEKADMEPHRLCLEITETVLMEDLEWSIETLLALKALGVRIAIDDFGTGYSSLNYLRRLPIDVVKIDRSFVAGLGADPAADAIVAAVINLSHALGFRVVAEGVEREEQLVALRALGCDLAQGFYWSAPVSIGELRQALTSDIAVVEQCPVDLRAILSERVVAVRGAAATASRSVLLRAPARLPAAVADAGAVRAVLDHLLSNALRFSPDERPVMIAASADRRWVRVSVSDYGVGMSDADMARCFEPFWHGEARAGQRSGTGIGLYIVRSLVEKMGGQVWVRSSPGKGSTFTIALPRAVAGTSTPTGKEDAAAPRLINGEQTVIGEFMRQLGVPR